MTPRRRPWTARIAALRAGTWAKVFVVVGLMLRLHQYLYNRALWGDESSLAVNIVERDLTGLLQPLERSRSLRGRGPVWFLFSGISRSEGLGERFVRWHLEQVATHRETVRDKGVVLHLYDL